ncbi:DUF499 domain-containing protein [Lutispora saccharofermentans]|uniref:DUF499 domain-containing protein n=1 Tax=Lutispora saccharofermentans TaxID=3024236 RepID=A0ABT1NJA9_9FIRM|nr:DUF499 domain-containing protein [Lutispora saccharofermentans]MCQ1531159.1 DUF499 domain-containing protein [Lutispora saccharofermentans]
MKTVFELCKPRASVFIDTTRDDVLNLSDLIENRIDIDKFFNENFKTKGMELLLHTAFKRFKSEFDTGVIKLTQAMGGGKTHNMLALALLANNREWRSKILGREYDDIGNIRVVAFSGRESDADYGIWGSVAEQLGKKEVFKDLYTPLKAPGESAWIKLLQGENTLILFDELPPYLENAKSITVGNSDLCKVTITALSNLFSALGKEQLSNVCLVFSDLKATYESGSELLQSSFKDLENEANRSAINIEPVALNSDEIYDILKKRLFESYPFGNSNDVLQVAIAYKDALTRANKTGLTNYTGEKAFLGIKDSYPFHPSIKDLYARFKENPNFQQTRGLIKLMRQIVRQFYESRNAESKYLIRVFDINLNDRNMLSQIKQIKASLESAISHDIAEGGKSVSEAIDAEDGTGKSTYAQDVSKLLLISSLSEATHGLMGLTESEILGYLCEPNVELNNYKKALEDIKAQSWYLKMDNRGRLYFQNTKNMVAEMNTLVESYSNENAKKELKKFLEENFKPSDKNCYEQLYVLPAIDEIEPDMNKVSLVIFEPYPGNKLHPDLKSFYDSTPYKNRVMFLSGQRNVMEKLYQNSKRLTAIRQIIANMEAEHVSATDQQYKEADIQKDKVTQALLQSIRETFITLYFPTKNGIVSEDFKLEFKENSFKGEEQIVKVLQSQMKFEDYRSDDNFLEQMRNKCEDRLFTQKEMTFNQIKERAATQTIWQWYHPDQLETLKKDCLKKDKWREIGGYLVKGPFAKEPTSVIVEQTAYDHKTGEFTLKIRGVRGDKVYYDIGAEPTSASAEAPSIFVTKEPLISFICIDTGNEHPTGDVKQFMCSVPLKYEQRTSVNGNVLELQTHKNFEIKYTTDGSNPKENGGVYLGEILLPKNCKYVRTAVMYKDKIVEEKDIAVSELKSEYKLNIKDEFPLEFERNGLKRCHDTEETYNEFEKLKKIEGIFIRHFTVVISEKDNNENYMELSASKVPYDADNLQATIDLIRETAFSGKDVTVEFDYKTILFTSGLQFKNWVEMNKCDISIIQKEGKIKQ